MEIGITATQWGLTKIQAERLFETLYDLAPSKIHYGDCIGGDTEAYDCVRFLNEQDNFHCATVCHPPVNDSKRAFTDADEYREPKEYLERNHDIVNESIILIACPREQEGEARRSGTWATVRYARKMRKPIIIIRPDGSIEREE